MANFDRLQADNWVKNGKLLDEKKKNLDNKAAGIEGAKAFEMTFNAPFNLPSQSKLDECYNLLNQSKKRLSLDDRQIITAYIADGKNLFLDSTPSEELLQYLKSKIGTPQKENKPDPQPQRPQSHRANFDKSQADNWIENGKLLDEVKRKLDNKAAGIEGAKAFDTTFMAPFNLPSRNTLDECYNLLNQSKKRLPRDGDRDYQQIISEYIFDGKSLFVDSTPSEELLQHLRNKLGSPRKKSKPAPQPQQPRPEQPRPQQPRPQPQQPRPQPHSQDNTDEPKKKKSGCWTWIIVIVVGILLFSGIKSIFKPKHNTHRYTPSTTRQETTDRQQDPSAKQWNNGSSPSNNRSTRQQSSQSQRTTGETTTQQSTTDETQQPATNAELEKNLSELSRYFTPGADGRTPLEVCAEYQALDDIANVGNLLRKAEKIAPNDSRVQNYRHKFNSTMKKYGLT